MAEECVCMNHFDEYTVRMDERFLSVEKCREQILPMPRRRGSRTLFP